MTPTSTLVAVRTAHHPETTPKYDRVVFEFRGSVPLIEVSYVKHMFEDGSGRPVTIAGTALVSVRFQPAQAHDDQGRSTAPRRVGCNMPLVKELVCAGDFEGIVTYGLGISRKAEVRFLTLGDASRVVIDIVH